MLCVFIKAKGNIPYHLQPKFFQVIKTSNFSEEITVPNIHNKTISFLVIYYIEYTMVIMSDNGNSDAKRQRPVLRNFKKLRTSYKVQKYAPSSFLPG